MTFGSPDADRTQKVAILVTLLIGAGIRLWQYTANASLWLDEAALSRNIIERSPRDLLDPLSYGQVAPIGFLYAQKTAVALFGSSEYALRLIPFSCGLASLPLFVVCASRILRGWAVVFATLLFALGQPFIYFSSQAKQYAPDVMLSLLAMLMGVRLLTAVAGRTAYAFAACGALLPWFSQTAGLVLVGAAFAATVVTAIERACAVRIRVSLLLLWIGSAGGAGLAARANVIGETRDYLDWFWRSGFLPLSLDAPGWAWRTLVNVFEAFASGGFRTNGGLGYAWPQLFAVATLVGVVHLVRTRRQLGLVLLGPILAALAASLLRLYPLSGRLMVFLVPVLLIFAAAGAHWIWSWFQPRARILGAAIAVVFCAIPIGAALRTRPPYSIQPVRPVLERMNTLRRPGDVIYVDYLAAQAFLYYAPRFGLEPGEYVIGDCAVNDRRDYLRQVDRYRGRDRFWIVGTHLSAVERALTVGYLERIGRRLESVFVPPSGAPLQYAAYARLYDLSDPRRLASASAATYTFRERPLDGQLRTWACAGPVVLEADEAGQ